jgi:hypothetical protein
MREESRATYRRIQELTTSTWLTVKELNELLKLPLLDVCLHRAFQCGFVERRIRVGLRGNPFEYLSTGKPIPKARTPKPKPRRPKPEPEKIQTDTDEDKGFIWPFNCKVCSELLTVSFVNSAEMYNTWMARTFTCSQCSTHYKLTDYAGEFKLAYGTSRCVGDRADKMRLGKSRSHSFA